MLNVAFATKNQVIKAKTVAEVTRHSTLWSYPLDTSVAESRSRSAWQVTVRCRWSSYTLSTRAQNMCTFVQYIFHSLFTCNYSEIWATFRTRTGTWNTSNRKYPLCSCCGLRGRKGASGVADLLRLVGSNSGGIFEGAIPASSLRSLSCEGSEARSFYLFQITVASLFLNVKPLVAYIFFLVF